MLECYAVIRVRDERFIQAFNIDEIEGVIKDDGFYVPQKKAFAHVKLNCSKEFANQNYKEKVPTSTEVEWHQFKISENLIGNSTEEEDLKLISDINNVNKEILPQTEKIFDKAVLIKRITLKL